MKFRFQTRYNTIAAYVVLTFAVCLGLAAFVFSFDTVGAYAAKIVHVLMPVIWGLVIAYLLNPPMLWIEKKLSLVLCRKKKHPILLRTISLSICIAVMLLLIIGIIYAIIPEIITSLKNIFTQLPDYLSNLQDYLTGLFNKYIDSNPELRGYLDANLQNIEDVLLGLADQYQPKLDGLLAKDGLIANVTSGAYTVLIGLKDFCLGIIVSVYVLFSKERFLAQLRKFVHAIFRQSRCEQIFRTAGRANYTFMHFLSGKALDSLIIGMLCFIILTILKMPYVTLISIIVGITNMIPFFGPFIGAIPCGLLILLSEPHRTLTFVIFILLLQQFDGNILGPKILGNSLNLSPFWIMFAIFLGGGLFGFIGMVAFVPLFAVLYAMIKDSVNLALQRKKLPTESDAYLQEGTVYAHLEKAEAASAETAPTPAAEPTETESGKEAQ